MHSYLVMNSIVISIGGSVVLSEDADISYFKKLNKLLQHFSKKYKIYLVVGGGKTARTYIKLGRHLGFDERTLDEIGIEITRINAKIMSNLIQGSNNDIPTTTNDAKKMKEPIVIMGGTTPGHSTDMVGAELAEKTKASKIIIATNVDGISDKDPNIHSDAKQIKEISINDLINKYGTTWDSAGKNIVIDGPALKIIHRAKIPTFVLNGKKLYELEKAINNQEFNGTIIKE
jgi:uridylate kinase